MIPLIMAQVGEVNTILKITGKDCIRLHLAEMGVVVGEEIEIISKLSGNMIVAVKNTRIAMDQSMTYRIMI